MTRRRATLIGYLVLALLTVFAVTASTSISKPKKKKKKHAHLTFVHIKVESGPDPQNPSVVNVSSGATVTTCPSMKQPVFYLGATYDVAHARPKATNKSTWTGPSFIASGARTAPWGGKSGRATYGLNSNIQGRPYSKGFLPGTYRHKVIEGKKVIGTASVTVALAQGCSI